MFDQAKFKVVSGHLREGIDLTIGCLDQDGNQDWSDILGVNSVGLALKLMRLDHIIQNRKEEGQGQNSGFTDIWRAING